MNKYDKQRGDTLVEIELVAEKLQWRICKVIDECRARCGKELSQIDDVTLYKTLRTIGDI